MKRNFHFAHGMAAGQVAHGVADQKQDRLGFTGGFAQRTQCILLVGRKPTLQKVDVIRHSVPCRERGKALPKSLILLFLCKPWAPLAKQYINTNGAGLLVAKAME